MPTIGQQILTEREKRGWSQTKLAQRARLTRETIYKLERGQRPQRQTLEEIAIAFDFPAHTFLAQPIVQAPAFCQSLRGRRRALRITLRACADVTGVSEALHSMFERGLVKSHRLAYYNALDQPYELRSDDFVQLLKGFGGR